MAVSVASAPAAVLREGVLVASRGPSPAPASISGCGSRGPRAQHASTTCVARVELASACSGASPRAPASASRLPIRQGCLRSSSSTATAASSTSDRTSSRTNAGASSRSTSGSDKGVAWLVDPSDDDVRDRDLWFVLEIASDQELQELADILYGRSLLSPLMKSVTNGDGTDTFLPVVPGRASRGSMGYVEEETGESPYAASSLLEEREEFLGRLEARFFYLAADARGTITGRHPTYRGVLQSVRQKLGVNCSPGLATADLEAEIFLHLCNKYATAEEESNRAGGPRDSSEGSSVLHTVAREGGSAVLRGLARATLGAMPPSSPAVPSFRGEGGAAPGAKTGGGARGGATQGGPNLRAKGSQLKREALKTLGSGVRAALDMNREEILTTILKGGSAVTLSSIRNMMVRKLGGKVLWEKARYQVASLLVEKGAKAAAAQVESHVALYAARQSLTGAAARYVGLRTAMSFLGPILWGAFLADIALQSLGTDYARIVRAIYTIAQIRLTRTYGWTRADDGQ